MRERTVWCWRKSMGAAFGAALLMLAVAGPAMAEQTGHAWAWGNNSYGQLGNGTNVESNVPVQVLDGGPSSPLDQVRSVDGGAGHSVAKLRSDFLGSPDFFSESRLRTWGLNSEGQLGDGSTSNRLFAIEPTDPNFIGHYTTSRYPQNASDVDSIAAGYFHTLYGNFLGAPSSWGRDSSGQLGSGHVNPDLAFSTNPGQVVLPSGGVTQVSAGKSHSLALRLDGTVFAWGSNSAGQLGNGSTVTGLPMDDSVAPVQVGSRIGRRRFPLTQVVAISAGADFSLALRKDGTVWAWGFNLDGELGDGTTTDSSIPVQVSGLTDVIAIGAGDRHSLAVKRDGTVWTWGYNGFGQLGDGTLENRSTPVQVAGLLGGVIAVAGGGYHSLALLSDGTVRAWGYNYFGQLGDGTFTDSATQVQVSGLTGVFSIGAGTLHSLAVRP